MQVDVWTKIGIDREFEAQFLAGSWSIPNER